jgi:hypothetical protein
MKQLAKNLCLALLLSSPILKVNADPKTLFAPISQGSNLYTQYHKVFYQDSDEDCDWSADLSLTYRYMQTRNEDKISAMILNSNSGNIKIQGDLEGGRDDGTALVADYFGFAQDADFSFNVKPRIQNNVFDLQFAIGGEKVWFQANAPLVWSKWRLNKDGVPLVSGDLSKGGYPFQGEGTIAIQSPTSAGNYVGFANDAALDTYLADSPVDVTYSDSIKVNELVDVNRCDLPTVTSAGQNVSLTNNYAPAVAALSTLANITTTEYSAPQSLADGLAGNKLGDIPARKYNNIEFLSDNTQWKIADVHLQLGYDFYKHDDKHFGLYIKAVLPTGTKLDDTWAQTLFNPIVGNRNHFELGGGMTGHLQLWECDESSFNGYIDAYITHMFKTSQTRTYDLDGLPMSRYATVKVLSPNQAASPATPDMPTSYTNITSAGDAYAYEGLARLGDVNTVSQDVSVNVRGEAILDLIYSYKNWEFGAGYAFSGQSKEKADSSLDAATSSKQYGFQGLGGTMTFGFIGTGGTAPSAVVKFVEQGSGGAFAAGTQLYVKTSSNVASADAGAYSYGSQTDPAPANDSNTFSLPSTNRSGLMEGQMLHRIFGHIDYVWSDCDWMPQLGVLGSFGFSQDSYRTAEYWDLGARFGFSF